MTLTVREKLKNTIHMFAVFFKIGLFSFGGGYAMLVMIENEVVDKRGWLTHSELMDIFAIAESTPGAISINIATFIGTKRAGIAGGIFTTLGVVLPSFLVIVGLSYIVDLVRDNVWVGYLFRGVRVGVLVLIARSVIKFFSDMKKTALSILLMLATFLLAILTDLSVIYIILGAILISTLVVALRHIRKKRIGIIDPEARQAEFVAEAEINLSSDEIEPAEGNEADDCADKGASGEGGEQC